MIINGIDTKDISVVVQGAIDKENTPICLKSIRKYLPDAEIILSTWEGSDVSGLDYDQVIFSEDPGSEIIDEIFKTQNNVNRQIVSTKNGLKASSRIYAIKIRSDMCIIGTEYLKIFNRFSKRNDFCKILKQRVVINNLYCSDPSKSELCFHISDWFFFGLREDLLNIWDIDLYPKEYNAWCNPKDKQKESILPTINFRYLPEQYIWTLLLRNNNIDFNFDNYGDFSNYNLVLTHLSFANNLIVLNYENSGIKFLKYNPYKWDYNSRLTYEECFFLYTHYCLNDKKIGSNDVLKKQIKKILKIILSPLRIPVRILKILYWYFKRFVKWC